MPSETEICNLALSHIGNLTINTFSDPSQEARKCKIYYPLARDYVLHDHDWGFAERRESLALMANFDFPGYDYAYQYPADCIKARRIHTLSPFPVDYAVVAAPGLSDRLVVTNQADAILVYTAKLTDPNIFDPSFVVALSYKLAADLAQPLTKNLKLQEAMLGMYTVFLSRAKTVNSNEAEKTENRAQSNSFLLARS